MLDRLTVEIAGLKLSNPIMLASGILGMTGLSLKRVFDAGAGAVVTKSVGLQPNVGYSNPSVVQVECGLLNAIGLPNPGVSSFANEIRQAKREGCNPIIVSVYGFSPEEYAEVAKISAEAGADALELNLSCPHVLKTGAEIGQNPKLVADVVKKVKSVVRKPIFVKLTPNVADITEIARATVNAGADAITAINAIKAMAIDANTMRPILSNKVGGLSGLAIKPIALRCVYEIYEELNVPVVGCGGITTWRDAVEFMLAGATAIQIGTAIALKGPGIFRAVARGINAYLKMKGFRSVAEIVGLAHKN